MRSPSPTKPWGWYPPPFKTHGLSTLSVSLDMTGEKLVAGGESKVVQMWVSPNLVATLSLPNRAPVDQGSGCCCHASSSDGLYHSLACSERSGYDAGGAQPTVLPNDAFTSPPASSLSSHPFHLSSPPLIHPNGGTPWPWHLRAPEVYGSYSKDFDTRMRRRYQWAFNGSNAALQGGVAFHKQQIALVATSSCQYSRRDGWNVVKGKDVRVRALHCIGWQLPDRGVDKKSTCR